MTRSAITLVHSSEQLDRRNVQFQCSTASRDCVRALPKPMGDQYPSAALINGIGSNPHPNPTTVSVVGVAQTKL